MILLEKVLFYLFVLCLPLGTRKLLYTFGPEFNEWNSIFIYLTDILLLSVFLCWFLRKDKIDWKRGVMKAPLLWIVSFLMVAFLSLLSADKIWLGVYFWLRLVLLSFLYIYVRYSDEISRKVTAILLIIGGVIQSLFSLTQFTFQNDLNLFVLGESSFDINTVGVAKITTDTVRMVRAYGTFLHPNILAAFLLLSLCSLYYLWQSKNSFKLTEIAVFSSLLFILLTGLFLTFSRLYIALFLLISLFLFRKSLLAIFSLLFSYLVLGVLFLPELLSRFSISLTEQSVSLRVFYNHLSLYFIREYPFLGVGLGNFVWRFGKMMDLLPSWLYQPVHNIYLLIINEVGLIGFALFLMVIYTIYLNRKGNKVFVILFIAFLLAAMFDHFFWSIWQGSLIFWLVLSFI